MLNNYQIKLLAALFMVIDHVGVVFFPETAVLRVIGRLSFPLFAWLLAEGERHTHNFRQYLLRLLILGVISQPIYQFALGGTYINILLMLALGLVTLRLSRRFEQYYFIIWATAIIAAELLRLEYGAYGMAVIWLLANIYVGDTSLAMRSTVAIICGSGGEPGYVYMSLSRSLLVISA